MHKQTLGNSIYSGLQKGLHIGQMAVEYTALAKGIYETGQTLFSITYSCGYTIPDSC